MPKTVDLEAALIKALDLGLKGDRSSLRQHARQVLKKVNKDESELRQALSRLVAEAGGGSSELRWAGGGAATVMGDEASFVRTEELSEADQPVLPDEVRESIEEVITERRSLDQLVDLGLSPTRSLLMVGPPGVGKTMTARYIAASIGLPLMTVDLGAVMSRFLGRTGQNLRQAMERARLVPSVCLLDEFDALGKKRDDPTDVGELKRVVTVVLQELETWPDHGLLVAATNHPELLDRAVWRRFDRVVDLPLPSPNERVEIASREVGRHGHELSDDVALVLGAITEGWSGSDMTRVAQEAVRGVVLDRWPNVERALTELLVRGLVTSTAQDEGLDPAAEFARVAVDEAGLSQRTTARLMGVSHPTVASALRKVKNGARA